MLPCDQHILWPVGERTRVIPLGSEWGLQCDLGAGTESLVPFLLDQAQGFLGDGEYYVIFASHPYLSLKFLSSFMILPGSYELLILSVMRGLQ
jgi:hypothetical protein